MWAEIPIFRIFSLGITPDEHHRQMFQLSWKNKKAEFNALTNNVHNKQAIEWVW